jgi:hypothetical protein
MQVLIFSCLIHPHAFIKTVCLRLVLTIFEEMRNDFYKLITNITESDDSLLNGLIINLKHVILEHSSSEKLVNTAYFVCLILLENLVKMTDHFENKLYSDLAYEFICRLYIDSKKYLSKKEKSVVIFGRIFNLFDMLITKYNTNTIEIFLDPILSLIHRINTNKLLEDEIKRNSNHIFEKISKKYDNNEHFNSIYKTVTKNINLLRRKRRMELLQEAINNPKQ